MPRSGSFSPHTCMDLDSVYRLTDLPRLEPVQHMAAVAVVVAESVLAVKLVLYLCSNRPESIWSLTLTLTTSKRCPLKSTDEERQKKA